MQSEKERIRIVEASIFKHLPDDLKDSMLLRGWTVVNDIFLPIWEKDNPIMLLYGSFGSGKSVAIVDRWIDKARFQPYFRGYFGRKILETVRGTVFKTITDRIKERKLEGEFFFSDKPNGSMHIMHKVTGNEMIPFGASDSASLKSIKDPTDFFCEEFDQFSFVDFGNIYSRLRTLKAKTQLWAAFNTEKVYKSHWIRRVLFEGEYAGETYRLKANYYHNEFLDKQDYEKKLRLIANGDAARFNAIAHGEWGAVRTGMEFWKQFNEARHVKKLGIAPTTMHITLDENVNPYVTVACWQVDSGEKRLRQVHEIPCYSPDNNAPKAAARLATWLKSLDYKDVVYLYGDPSASKRSTIDANNSSFYDKFIEVLRREGFTVISRVQRSAPEVALSAAFINAIYEHNHEGWSIEIHERCFVSIEDYMLVKEDAEGKMLKEKVKDEETKVTYEPAGHFSDAKRYFITTVLAAEFARYKARSRRMGSRAA